MPTTVIQKIISDSSARHFRARCAKRECYLHVAPSYWPTQEAAEFHATAHLSNVLTYGERDHLVLIEHSPDGTWE